METFDFVTQRPDYVSRSVVRKQKVRLIQRRIAVQSGIVFLCLGTVAFGALLRVRTFPTTTAMFTSNVRTGTVQFGAAPFVDKNVVVIENKLGSNNMISNIANVMNSTQQSNATTHTTTQITRVNVNRETTTNTPQATKPVDNATSTHKPSPVSNPTSMNNTRPIHTAKAENTTLVNNVFVGNTTTSNVSTNTSVQMNNASTN